MSVLIKGMEMPKNCYECPFGLLEYTSQCYAKTIRNKFACCITHKTKTSTKRNRFCPLEELPNAAVEQKGKTMDDLISRQAAIDAISRISDHGNSDRANALGLAESSIKALPTAVPSVVTMNLEVDKESLRKAMEEAELTLLPAEKKGKWIDYCGGVKCDQCGFECDDTYYLGEANFCPNCGARMTEESE